MSTCKTFEKETLLPRILGGARDLEVIKGGADPEKKKKQKQRASTSTTAI